MNRRATILLDGKTLTVDQLAEAAYAHAEIRSLCHPVSIQTLTTTGDFQDHVSFGLVAARRPQ